VKANLNVDDPASNAIPGPSSNFDFRTDLSNAFLKAYDLFVEYVVLCYLHCPLLRMISSLIYHTSRIISDLLPGIFDQLQALRILLWPLEWIPHADYYQQEDGTWVA